MVLVAASGYVLLGALRIASVPATQTVASLVHDDNVADIDDSSSENEEQDEEPIVIGPQGGAGDVEYFNA